MFALGAAIFVGNPLRCCLDGGTSTVDPQKKTAPGLLLLVFLSNLFLEALVVVFLCIAV